MLHLQARIVASAFSFFLRCGHDIAVLALFCGTESLLGWLAWDHDVLHCKAFKLKNLTRNFDAPKRFLLLSVLSPKKSGCRLPFEENLRWAWRGKVFSDNSDLVIIVIIEMMNPLVLKTSTETKASGAPITDLAISEWILRWVCTNQSFEHQWARRRSTARWCSTLR